MGTSKSAIIETEEAVQKAWLDSKLSPKMDVARLIRKASSLSPVELKLGAQRIRV